MSEPLARDVVVTNDDAQTHQETESEIVVEAFSIVELEDRLEFISRSDDCDCSPPL
jgi:hypothetical protein